MSTCTHPKIAWYDRSTRQKLRFTLPKPHEINNFDKISLPCNKCDKCQASYAMDWSVRSAMEMHTHEQSTFITLTYSEVDEVPTLKPDDMTNFIKRLRNYLAKNHPATKIRYLQCGEYGSQYSRPHHHAIIFGFDFPDLEFHGKSGKDEKMYTSQILENLWTHGHCIVQDANMATALYISGYISKKIYGSKDSDGIHISGGSNNTHYNKVDKETGEIHQIHREYMTMSRMPGLGHSFYDQYKNDMFPLGKLHLPNSNGKLVKFNVPSYFYRKLAEDDTQLYLESIHLKHQAGIDHQEQHPLESSPDRLRVKAFIQKKRSQEKSRPLDGIEISNHVDMSFIDQQQQLDKQYEKRLSEQQAFEEKHKHQLNLT